MTPHFWLDGLDGLVGKSFRQNQPKKLFLSTTVVGQVGWNSLYCISACTNGTII